MHPITRLIGRGRELAEAERLLEASRLVTFIGTGGSGKTRLAAELAARNGSMKWVELAAWNDPAVVAQQTAAALSLSVSCYEAAVPALIDALTARDVVLVFDNCEHLIDACADLAATLLSRCSRLRILATSRAPLGVPGEQIFPVPPLASSEAVELFVERATAADPSFARSEDTSAAIEEICRRLDGIPLAIELAAARVRMLTPGQIAQRLAEGFAILSGGTRTALPRHRTLRAAIDWSYELLGEAEQILLARLSVFAGTFSLESAEAVCGADVLDLLSDLVDKSLVCGATTDGAAIRYRLLDTIRHYAAETLAAMEDAHEVRRRHATAFRDLAVAALPGLMEASVETLGKLERDRDNFRAALEWSLEHSPDVIALPLAAAMRWFWYYRINWGEGLQWMRRVLERSSAEPDRARASVTAAAGTFAGYLGDLDGARQALEQAEAMWRSIGDSRELALTLSALSQTLATARELESAKARADEALALARNEAPPWDLPYVLTNAAAFVAQVRGELEEADAFLEEAERIWTATRHQLGLPFVLSVRALLAVRRCDRASAARMARAALLETRSRRELWFASRALRILAFTTDDPRRAARLLGAADGMLRAMTVGILLYERIEYERALKGLRESLPGDEVQKEMSAGAAMSFDEACDYALLQDAAESIDALPSEIILRVQDLGPLRITQGGKPLETEGPSSGRARELLLLLLAHPAGMTREEAGVQLWPDATAEQVRNSFHVTLHRLRRILGKQESVVNADGRYRISGELPHDVVSREFEKRTTAALRSGEIEALESALSLYAGDYLAGEQVSEWADPIRTRLRLLYVRGRFALGQALEARGNLSCAADSYAAVVERDEFHEAAWRRLMVSRARLGFRSEALHLYRELEDKLRQELDSAPEGETRALYRRLQADEAV